MVLLATVLMVGTTAGLLTLPAVPSVAPSDRVFLPGVPNLTRDLQVQPATGSSIEWSMVCEGGGATVSARCVPQPPNLIYSAGAWDAADNQFLVFGGVTGSTYWSATMAFKFGSPHWSVLSPGTVPPGAANASMTYDSTDNYPLLVDGYTKNGTGAAHWLADTYKFTGGNWVSVTVPGGFEKRTGACLINVPAYSGHGGYVLLYGGSNSAGYVTSTWEYSAGSWTNVTTTAGTLVPSGRTDAGCSYDSEDHYGILFGGIGSGGTVDDTWEWNPAVNTTGSWHLLDANGASGQPGKRFSPFLADVPTAGYVELYSGATGTVASPSVNPVADFWKFVGGTWTNITTSTLSNGRLPCAGSGAYGGVFATIPGVGSLKVNGVCSSSSNDNETFLYGNPLVTDNLSENLGEIPLGGSVTLYSNATGGTGAGSYTMAYSGLPSGCSSTNTSTLSCTPTATGVFSLSASATDAAGEKGMSATFPLVVDADSALTGSLSVGGTSIAALAPHWLMADIWSNWTANHTFSSDLNNTLFRQLHFYGQFDKTNISKGYQGTMYGSGGSATSYVTYNLSQYAAICKWIRGGCSIYDNPPGQTNDTGATVDDFETMEARIGTFAYIGIGTEANNYNHYGIPFTSWSSSNNVAPTGLQLATQIRTDYGYIHPLDPGAPWVEQLSGGNSYNKSIQYYSQNLSLIDCGKISAIGLDYYPQQGSNYGNPNLAAFYSNISNLAGRISLVRNAWTAGNSSCAQPQVWLTEFRPSNGGSIPGDFAHDYLGTYAEVPYIAAETAQALTLGIGTMGTWALFEDRNDQGAQAAGFSLINTSTLSVTPAYTLYSNGPLGHLALGSAGYLNVTGAPGHTFAVRTWNATTTSYLVVNANTTVPLELSTRGIPTGVPWSIYNETSIGVDLAVDSANVLPSTIFVPAQSVLLIDVQNTSSAAAPANGIAEGGGVPGFFATTGSSTDTLITVLAIAGVVVLFIAIFARGASSSRIRR